MEWSDLRILLAVCDSGSASAASRTLLVDKATVSRRVCALERQLGVRLVVRRAGGWRPTRAGQRVAVAARAMEGQARGLLADLAGAHGKPRSTVSITAPHWFCRRLLLPALPRLLAEAPWLDLALGASSRVLNLAQREADVAVRNRRPAEGELVVRRAGVLGSALYASRAYLKERGTPSASGQLGGHALVGYPDRMSYVPGFEWLDAAVGSAASVVRADDADALFEGVRAGMGLAVLPCLIGDPERALARVGEPRSETIWLVSPTELAGTRAVKVTLAFLVDLFRRNQQALAGDARP